MSSEIGVDHGSGKDETVAQVAGGCARCRREWPQTNFKSMAQAIANGQTVEQIVCDSCLITSDAQLQIAKAITEATDPSVPGLERRVVVSGINSGTSVIQFEYVTHKGMEALVVSDVTVHFCKNPKALDAPRTTYIYKAVPVAVVEAWFVAPSKGGYFIQFIKQSYASEKVK